MKLLTVKLRVSIEYSDIEYYCKSSALSVPLVLTLELNDKNKAVKGSIKKDKNLIYFLDENEVNNIKVLSEKELSWIKSIDLSDSLLRFFIYSDSKYRNMCVPPEKLEIYSNKALIDFGISFVGYLLPQMLNSNVLTITGKNSNNNLYQIKFSLTQIRT